MKTINLFIEDKIAAAVKELPSFRAETLSDILKRNSTAPNKTMSV